MLLLFASGALNVTLYFVILLWAFNCSGADSTASLFGTRVTYSPRVMGFVFIGLVICYLAPYLRGIYLGRQTLKVFHKARREYLNRIIRVLKCPEIEDAEGALGMLHDELTKGITSFQEEDPAFSQADLLTDENQAAEELKYDKQAFPIAREHDIRFEHLGWFSHLVGLVENARESIKKQVSAESKKMVMSQWIPFFEQYKTELTEHIEASPRASALLVLGILASATVGAIFSKAGDALWDVLKGVLK